MAMERISVLGVHFDPLTMEQALAHLIQLIESGGREYVVTPNPEFVYACDHDPSLYPLLNEAGLCVPDGIGIIHAAKILGTPLPERVPGIELGEALLAWAAEHDCGVFLLGAKPGVADLAGKKLCEKYPGLRIAGTHDGYFTDDAPVVAEIAASGAQIALICMGFPRQERFMARHLVASGVHVMLGLGGSLDVFAGNVQRAPEFYRKAGLEWLYRLLREPSRLGRMMKLPAFLWTGTWRKWTKSEEKVRKS